MIYSWLRHVKKCQIAQTNWKTSPLWKAAPDRKEDMRAVVAEIQQHFIALNLNVFKNDQDLEQALRQVEGDVIGISWSSGEPTLYAAESAFHEFGLNYGSKEVTCAKVISKLARTAIALQIFLPGLNSELFFASPKIHNNIMEILPKAIDELNAIFERHSMNCKARLIANGDFQKEILDPVKALQENVSDTSEIFLRSLQMVNLFSRGRRRPDIIDFVDENEDSGNDEDEDNGIEDDEDSGIEDDEDSVPSQAPYQGLRVGQIVSRYLRPWLENNCTAEQAERFLSRDYSRQVFGISFPLLQRERIPDARGHHRYSPRSLNIHNKTYYICTQWYIQHRARLIDWLNRHS